VKITKASKLEPTLFFPLNLRRDTLKIRLAFPSAFAYVRACRFFLVSSFGF
jgi:hypothetical protein